MSQVRDGEHEMSGGDGDGATGARDDSSSASGRPRDFHTTVDLVGRAQGGSQTAVNDLFARYHDRVLRIVRLNMGRELSSYIDHEDVVQEALLAAFLDLDRFEMRSEGSFLHWVSEIARNRIRRAAEFYHAQKRDRRKEQFLEGMRAAVSSGELCFEPAGDITRADEKVARQDDLQRIEECVRELKDEYREIFVARYYEWGEPRWQEIAKELGKESPDAARMLFARAEVAVLKCLRKKEQGGR